MRLQKATAIYIEFKNAHGIEFTGATNTLAQFVKRIGNIDIGKIRSSHISTFLSDPRIGPRTWRDKYFTLYRFLEFCYARHYLSNISMPERRKTLPFIFSPRLFSRMEIQRLIRAVPVVQKGRKLISADTFQTLLLFLYGTGAAAREAIQLRCEDIDFKKRKVSLRASRGRGVREIPLGKDLCMALASFRKRNPRDPSSLFFQKSDGEAIYLSLVHLNFRALRVAARIVRPGGPSRQPRLFDLKHSFAVHRITSWIKRGADMNRLMPALSVYLGFASLSSTEQYLRWVPNRFKPQLGLIAKQTEPPTWHRDRNLMRFLSNL